jgi:putative Holliday junction resolvase
MARILAIDYGARRCGMAWTDPLCLIPSPLPPVDTVNLFSALAALINSGPVDKLVIGYPRGLDGRPTDATIPVDTFLIAFTAQWPEVAVILWDERFSSKMAQQLIREAGVKKQKRKNKQLIDTVSAVLILQNYLQSLQ